MARLEVSGLDDLMSGFSDMAEQAPKLRDDILNAEADVIETALRKSIVDDRLVRSGKLLQSIRRRNAKSSGIPVVRIGPTGEHHRYLPSSGKNGIVSAGYVGYIGEYGIRNRGIPGRKWLSNAVEKNQGKAFDAADAVYNNYMEKNHL